MEPIEKYRDFLKGFWWEERDKVPTDQKKGLEAPPLLKPYHENATLIDLPAYEEFKVREVSLREAIRRRKTYRRFTEESLSIEELSYLLGYPGNTYN